MTDRTRSGSSDDTAPDEHRDGFTDFGLGRRPLSEADPTMPEPGDPPLVGELPEGHVLPDEGEVLLSVRGLKVHFPIRKGILFDRTIGHVKAVDGIDLDVRRGETYGLVGESGCGKSTFGRGILRLSPVTEGSVMFAGTDVATLHGAELRAFRRRMQMVFQDPMSSLDPRQNVSDALGEGMKAHGLFTEKQGRAIRVAELLDAVGLPRSAATRYPHEFSGGQRQRIGIARALALDPELIVADEPVSALDVSIQAQVVNLLADLQKQLGLTYIVIAHDLAVVRHISDRVGVMYLGGLVEEAGSNAIVRDPKHPYTRALLSAVPVPDPVVESSRHRLLLPGDLPSPANPPKGCRFHTRCPWVQETRCASERPELRVIAPAHRVACHWAEDIDAGRIKPVEIDATETALAGVGATDVPGGADLPAGSVTDIGL